MRFDDQTELNRLEFLQRTSEWLKGYYKWFEFQIFGPGVHDHDTSRLRKRGISENSKRAPNLSKLDVRLVFIM